MAAPRKKKRVPPFDVTGIDFSVITTSLETGGKMIEQIMNGIQYGSPEVRLLMLEECELIIECRVCRGLFRALPNFIAHKRVYCCQPFCDHAHNMHFQAATTVVPPAEHPVVVEPVAPEDGKARQAKEKSKEQKKDKGTTGSKPGPANDKTKARPHADKNDTEAGQDGRKTRSQLSDSAVAETVHGIQSGQLGHSKEYAVYTAAAEKVEKERVLAERSVPLHLAPIPATPYAVSINRGGGGEPPPESNTLSPASAVVPSSTTAPPQQKGKNVAGLQSKPAAGQESSTGSTGPVPAATGSSGLAGKRAAPSKAMLRNVTKVVKELRRKKGEINSEKSVTKPNAPVSKLLRGLLLSGPDLLSSKEKSDETRHLTDSPSSSSKSDEPFDTKSGDSDGLRAVVKRCLTGRPGSVRASPHRVKTSSADRSSDVDSISEAGSYSDKGEPPSPLLQPDGTGENPVVDLANLRCKICNKNFLRRKSLLYHCQSRHSGQRTIFPCPYCPCVFYYFWGLTRHLNTNHRKSRADIDRMRNTLHSKAYKQNFVEESRSSSTKQGAGDTSMRKSRISLPARKMLAASKSRPSETKPSSPAMLYMPTRRRRVEVITPMSKKSVNVYRKVYPEKRSGMGSRGGQSMSSPGKETVCRTRRLVAKALRTTRSKRVYNRTDMNIPPSPPDAGRNAMKMARSKKLQPSRKGPATVTSQDKPKSSHDDERKAPQSSSSSSPASSVSTGRSGKDSSPARSSSDSVPSSSTESSASQSGAKQQRSARPSTVTVEERQTGPQHSHSSADGPAGKAQVPPGSVKEQQTGTAVPQPAPESKSRTQASTKTSVQVAGSVGTGVLTRQSQVVSAANMSTRQSQPHEVSSQSVSTRQTQPQTVSTATMSTRQSQPQPVSVASMSVRQSQSQTGTAQSVSTRQSQPQTVSTASMLTRQSQPQPVSAASMSTRQSQMQPVSTASMSIKQSQTQAVTTQSVSTRQSHPQTVSAVSMSTRQSQPQTTVAQSISARQSQAQVVTTQSSSTRRSQQHTVTSQIVSARQSQVQAVTSQSISARPSQPHTASSSSMATRQSQPLTVSPSSISSRQSHAQTVTTESISTRQSQPQVVQSQNVSTRPTPPHAGSSASMSTRQSVPQAVMMKNMSTRQSQTASPASASTQQSQPRTMTPQSISTRQSQAASTANTSSRQSPSQTVSSQSISTRHSQSPIVSPQGVTNRPSQLRSVSSQGISTRLSQSPTVSSQSISTRQSQPLTMPSGRVSAKQLQAVTTAHISGGQSQLQTVSSQSISTRQSQPQSVSATSMSTRQSQPQTVSVAHLSTRQSQPQEESHASTSARQTPSLAGPAQSISTGQSQSHTGSSPNAPSRQSQAKTASVRNITVTVVTQPPLTPSVSGNQSSTRVYVKSTETATIASGTVGEGTGSIVSTSKPLISALSSIPLHVCPHCQRTFGRKISLDSHMKICSKAKEASGNQTGKEGSTAQRQGPDPRRKPAEGERGRSTVSSHSQRETRGETEQRTRASFSQRGVTPESSGFQTRGRNTRDESVERTTGSRQRSITPQPQSATQRDRMQNDTAKMTGPGQRSSGSLTKTSSRESSSDKQSIKSDNSTIERKSRASRRDDTGNSSSRESSVESVRTRSSDGKLSHHTRHDSGSTVGSSESGRGQSSERTGTEASLLILSRRRLSEQLLAATGSRETASPSPARTEGPESGVLVRSDSASRRGSKPGRVIPSPTIVPERRTTISVLRKNLKTVDGTKELIQVNTTEVLSQKQNPAVTKAEEGCAKKDQAPTASHSLVSPPTQSLSQMTQPIPGKATVSKEGERPSQSSADQPKETESTSVPVQEDVAELNQRPKRKRRAPAKVLESEADLPKSIAIIKQPRLDLDKAKDTTSPKDTPTSPTHPQPQGASSDIMKTRNPTRGGTSDDNNEELAAVVEEIWMDKKPGRPTERVRSNRIYVVEPDRAGRLTCQDTRKVEQIVDETGLTCLHCDQHFTSVSNLRRHAIRHLGWKRFKCRLCRFCSYNRSECNTHIMRSHPERVRSSGSGGARIDTFITDLNRQAASVRSLKKRQTLDSRRREGERGGDQRGASSTGRQQLLSETGEDRKTGETSPTPDPPTPTEGTSARKTTPSSTEETARDKPSSNVTFNISTRNSPRKFDTRPFPRDQEVSATTLTIRKGSCSKPAVSSLAQSLAQASQEEMRQAVPDGGKEKAKIFVVAVPQTPAAVTSSSSGEGGKMVVMVKEAASEGTESKGPVASGSRVVVKDGEKEQTRDDESFKPSKESRNPKTADKDESSPATSHRYENADSNTKRPREELKKSVVKSLKSADKDDKDLPNTLLEEDDTDVKVKRMKEEQQKPAVKEQGEVNAVEKKSEELKVSPQKKDGTDFTVAKQNDSELMKEDELQTLPEHFMSDDEEDPVSRATKL